MQQQQHAVEAGQAAPSNKSTATEAQLDRLKRKLRARSHHTIELRQFGIHHPAGRVQDLEAQGFVIEVTRVTAVDAEGFPHAGVALYTLVSEPVEVAQ